MPGEKEININLLNVLDLLERLEMADQDGGHEKLKAQIAFEKKMHCTKTLSKTTVRIIICIYNSL